MALVRLAALVYFCASCSNEINIGTQKNSVAPGFPSPEFLFVTSLIEGDGATNENLLLFEKNFSSCSLTLLNTYNVGPDPYDLVYHRDTGTLYVANSFNGTINAFKFNTSTRQLTNAGSVTQVGPTASPLPFMMAVHANGFLYAVDGNATTSSIGQFTQNQTTGALTQMSNPNQYTTAAGRSWFVALAGDFLYVNDYSNALIRQYSINPTTGLLTALGTPTIGTGNQPWSMFVHNSGNFLYTTNSGAGSVSQFSRNTTTGQLTQIAAPLSAGANTIGLAVGTQYLYASGNNSQAIYQFAINQSTGALTALAQPSVATLRPNPYGIALSRDEQCLYAAELTGNNGNSANDEIGIYTATNGGLSRQGSISGGIGPRFFAVAY